MKADLTPNRRGAREIGVWAGDDGMSGDDYSDRSRRRGVEVLIIVGHDVTQQLSAREQSKLDQHCDYILHLATHDSARPGSPMT